MDIVSIRSSPASWDSCTGVWSKLSASSASGHCYLVMLMWCSSSYSNYCLIQESGCDPAIFSGNLHLEYLPGNWTPNSKAVQCTPFQLIIITVPAFRWHISSVAVIIPIRTAVLKTLSTSSAKQNLSGETWFDYNRVANFILTSFFIDLILLNSQVRHW